MGDRRGGESEKRSDGEGRGDQASRSPASGLDDPLGQHSKLAVVSAAEELGVDPLALARRLNQGEIARFAHLLNAALRHVENPGLRHRIEDLLMAVTDGVMPGTEPETELDWALRVTRRRRQERDFREEKSADDAGGLD